uniref:Reverse transcriptase domain-containing protein n=1 Tax=Pygocentrus nattereri TaxID=42514 RepID=A0AAR2K341_PYGNA
MFRGGERASSAFWKDLTSNASAKLLDGLIVDSDVAEQVRHGFSASSMAVRTLRYSFIELYVLQNTRCKPPDSLYHLRNLGILRRPKYSHRGSGRTFMYKQHANTISTLWTSCRRTIAMGISTRASGRILHYVKTVNLPALNTDFNVNCALLNVRSLNNKAPLIADAIVERNIDLLCLTETWQQPNDYFALNQTLPAGFLYVCQPRLTGRGGGLAVVYRSNLKVRTIPLPPLTSFECLSLLITASRSVLILLIYRPPKMSPVFISELSDMLSSFIPVYSNLLLLGDFNIHVDSESCSFAKSFLDLLNCFDIVQNVNFPTHNKGHVLDIVCSTGITPTNLHGVELFISDHKAVFFNVVLPCFQRGQRNSRQFSFRTTKNISPSVLMDMLSQIDHSDFNSDNANQLVTHYDITLSAIFNELAPLKTRKVSFTQSAPWFTPELRKLKSAGRLLERRWRRTGMMVHALAYKDHVGYYKEELQKAKTLYFSNVIQCSTDNLRGLFQTVNKLICPLNCFPLTPSADLCSKFINFFNLKIDSIYSQFAFTRPILNHQSLSVQFSGSCLSNFSTVNESFVGELIMKSRATTCQLDPIPTQWVKSCLPAICPLITKVINASLTAGLVPPCLKLAAVTPVLKKPGLDPENFANFRPISNLPLLAKVLERTVASQLHEHLESNDLYEVFQSGFRRNHSTETTLLRVVNDLLLAADQGMLNVLILLDLTAAFDTVCHNLLLPRLETLIGISGTALSWFKSYLSDRQQFVSIGGYKSDLCALSRGVPQGSVLGPLLFILYMLPLGNIIRRHGLQFHCFADDVQIYVYSKPSHTCPPAVLSDCLLDVRAWLVENFLSLNGTKTEAILISSPATARKLSNLAFSIPGFVVSSSAQVRNLGVIFDTTLSFEPHIKNVCKTAFFHLKNISRIRPFLSSAAAEIITHAFVTSRLDYCNAVLHGLP